MKKWTKVGLLWGAIMFVIMSIIYPLIIGEKITTISILIGVVIWTIGGILFGYLQRKRIENVN